MRILNDMFVVANTKDVLAQVRANREKHIAIVAEAKQGYIARAKEALQAKLNQLNGGKPVSLSFPGLMQPLDYTSTYDTAIAMLELHTEPTIKLDSEQVQGLIRDEWGFRKAFLDSTSAYSGTARELSEQS